mmetsp:Transcript_85054/g.259813  ORF Transcript_85054/g.259813 Transcript_85054/m.259813 type:complete len:256 (-) Transcript_85054:84-851(-)
MRAVAVGQVPRLLGRAAHGQSRLEPGREEDGVRVHLHDDVELLECPVQEDQIQHFREYLPVAVESKLAVCGRGHGMGDDARRALVAGLQGQRLAAVNPGTVALENPGAVMELGPHEADLGRCHRDGKAEKRGAGMATPPRGLVDGSSSEHIWAPADAEWANRGFAAHRVAADGWHRLLAHDERRLGSHDVPRHGIARPEGRGAEGRPGRQKRRGEQRGRHRHDGGRAAARIQPCPDAAGVAQRRLLVAMANHCGA